MGVHHQTGLVRLGIESNVMLGKRVRLQLRSTPELKQLFKYIRQDDPV